MAVVGITGIDVGASGVRAAESVLSKTGEATLRRFGQRALPVGAVRGGVALDPAAVGRVVKEMWKEVAFPSTRVHLAVSSSQVAVRSIALPDLEPAELARALPFLVRDVVPIPLDRAIIDFVPTGERDSDGKRSGLLVAIPSEPVSGIVRALERAGLDVESVDLAAFAALRALLRSDASGELSAVVDLGATMTTVMVQEGGIPIMLRTVARGGDDITDVLSERLGLSRAEAEAQKRRVGLDDSVDANVAEVVRAALAPVLSEIRSSLAYFATSNPGKSVQEVRLTGGGSALAGIREAVASQQRLPVSVADPSSTILIAPHNADAILFSAVSAPAIGLTLGGSIDQSTRNNAQRRTALRRRISAGLSASRFGKRPVGAGQPAPGLDCPGEIDKTD